MDHSDRVAGVAMILLLTIGACEGSTAPDPAKRGR